MPAHERPTDREAAAAWESLFRAQAALLRRFARDDVWGELSLREYDVLFTLTGFPDRTARVRDLAEGGLLTQPSLSRLVGRLEAAGLVQRVGVPGDARGVGVRLTDQGLAVQREIGRRHVRSISRLLGGALDRDQTRLLHELCRTLLERQAGIPDPPGADDPAETPGPRPAPGATAHHHGTSGPRGRGPAR